MKSFMEEYGLITVAAIIIMIFVLVATPIGNALKGGVKGTVDKFTEKIGTDNGENYEGTGNELPEIGVDPSTREITDSWEQIQKAIDLGLYSTRYKIGDYKTLDLGSEGVVKMQIIAFNQDTLADGSGKAAISWLSKEVLATKHNINATNTIVGGWEESSMRSYLEESVYPLIPTETKAVIKEVSKISYSIEDGSPVQQTTQDKIWIPSYYETFGTNSYENSGAIYDLSSINAEIKYDNSNTDKVLWWNRSVIGTSNNFAYVDTKGNVGFGNPSASLGVVLGFCTGQAISTIEWTAFGDSITEKNTTATKNWVAQTSETLLLSCTNLGKGGVGYLRDGGFSQYFDSIPQNTELITFYGSFNDLSSSADIGSATDVYFDGANNSLAACMNYAYDYIQTNYPDAKLAVIAPAPWSTTNPEDSSSEASQYVAVMKEICELKGIPFLDLFHTSGMTPWDTEYKNNYYYNADGIHPNDEGHQILAEKISLFLQSVVTRK